MAYQNHSLRVRSVVLDGLTNQSLEEGDIIYLSIKQVAACIGGIPESHPYDVHRTVRGEQQMFVLVDTVIQAHPPGVERSGTGVSMQSND